MKLVAARCPHCGAKLDDPATRDRVTCRYCDTVVMFDTENRVSVTRRIDLGLLALRSRNFEEANDHFSQAIEADAAMVSDAMLWKAVNSLLLRAFDQAGVYLEHSGVDRTEAARRLGTVLTDVTWDVADVLVAPIRGEAFQRVGGGMTVPVLAKWGTLMIDAALICKAISEHEAAAAFVDLAAAAYRGKVDDVAMHAIARAGSLSRAGNAPDPESVKVLNQIVVTAVHGEGEPGERFDGTGRSSSSSDPPCSSTPRSIVR